MAVELHGPENFHIHFILFRIGAFMGLLPIKYNPLKSHSKDNPFEASWVLTIYSCFLWVTCTFLSVQQGKKFYFDTPRIIFLISFIMLSIQIYFVFWMVMARKSVLQILNKLTQLIRNNSILQISFIEWFAPFFPMAIIIPAKVVFSFRLIVDWPVLFFLDTFQSFGMVFTNGLIYIWILSSEKLYFNITRHVRLESRRLSVNRLQSLMTQSLDIEAFLYSISESCGTPYLTLSIFTVSLDIMYSNEALYSVDPASQEQGLASFQDVLSFVYWNYSLYIMACVCYRSHKLNIQVKRLKWILDEVQTKRTLDPKILHMVRKYEYWDTQSLPTSKYPTTANLPTQQISNETCSIKRINHYVT